jgi:hypothetical protein
MSTAMPPDEREREPPHDEDLDDHHHGLGQLGKTVGLTTTIIAALLFVALIVVLLV